MSFTQKFLVLSLATLAAACSSDSDSDSDSDADSATSALEGFSFFVTSTGSGDAGGNLGGLAGADTKCQSLGAAAGGGSRTWRAYLSTATENARDRIGSGPWYNKNGELIAMTVAQLHDAASVFNGSPNLIVDETGVNAPGMQHDILTGSDPQGMLYRNAEGAALTCADWTSNAATDVARVGHSDIPMNPMFSPSWNSAHDTQDCTSAGLVARGGAGRLYCFAAD